jgi:acyl carrier protein
METTTTTVDEEKMQKIREIVAEHLELTLDELTDTSLLVEDHAADSLGRIDILAAVEKEFGVTIDQSELERMINVESVYTVVTEASGR